jgi:hypothetical protein
MRIACLSGAVLCAVSLFVDVARLPAEDKPAEKKSAEKTKNVKVRELTLTVPESWTQKEASGFRAGQFAVPAVEKDKEKGEGEYVVFYFERGAGDVAANVKRWIGQFDEEGRKVKVFTGESKQGKYTLADLSGTFNKSIGPPIQMRTKKLEGWRVLAVILQKGDETYYIRYDAPQATAEATADAFRQSFGASAKDEKAEKQE